MTDPREGVTAAGTITTGADRAHVDAVYEPLLSAARASVNEADPDASLYLYGSVATGSAVVPDSDVDLVTIGLDPAPAHRLSGQLGVEFRHVCRAADVATMTDLDGDSDEAYGNRVFLRHYCVHLDGPPRHTDLPDYAADRRAARGFNGDIARHAERWQDALAGGDEPAAVGRRAARKTLLALAGIVSITDHTWTTDRSDAARRWASRDPQWAADVATLVTWAAGGASPDRPEVEGALAGVIAEIVRQFDELIGLWATR